MSKPRKRLGIFKILPRKILLAYFLGLVVILLASSLIVVIGVSQVAGANFVAYGKSVPGASSTNSQGMVLITEQSSRTIYTSRIPITIADALTKIFQTQGTTKVAHPITVTPVEVNGSIPIVVRGITTAQISAEDLGVSNTSGNWVVLGSHAAKTLNAKIGSLLVISSPFAHSKFNISVTSIISLGTEEDYEIMVPIALGEEIGNLPGGVANAILVPASYANAAKQMIGSVYNLRVNYAGPTGTFLILDSQGYAHYSYSIEGLGTNATTFSLSLPFGLYDMVLEENGFRTDLGQFVMQTQNEILNISEKGQPQSVYLTVAANSTSTPHLISSSGETINGTYDNAGNSWVFNVPIGNYTLLLSNGQRHNILLFENTTFNESVSSPDSSLFVQIINSPLSNGSGQVALTVQDKGTGDVIFSSYATTSNIYVPVSSNHTYLVTVLTPNTDILLQKEIVMSSVSGSPATLQFILPYIPQTLQNAPLSDYSSLGIGAPSQQASFNLLVGGAIVSMVALFVVVTVLLIIALVVLDSQFLVATIKEMKTLGFLSPRRSALFWKIKAPLFFVSAVAGAIAITVSLLIFEAFGFSTAITFLGYGLVSYPIVYAVPVVVALLFGSYIKISQVMSKTVYPRSKIVK